MSAGTEDKTEGEQAGAEAAAAATAAAATPAAASNTRPYGIFTELTVNLADPEAVVAAIKAQLTEGNEEAVLLLRVGRAHAGDPRAAVTSLAQFRDLDGDYTVIADSSRTVLPKVKTAVRRDVSIG